MKTIFYFLIFINFAAFCSSPDDLLNKNQKEKNKLQLLSEAKENAMPLPGFIDLNSRRTKSIIFSTLIPGSGQTYLGDSWKGAAITLAFFGSALTAVLNYNNFIAREDRIKTLTDSYKLSANYYEAESYYQEILKEKSARDLNTTRRKIFTIAAAAIWAYNIVDIIFFTDDVGENKIVLKNNTDGKIGLSFESVNDYNSLALKINLP